MALGIMFIGAPLVIYLFLVVLPAGRSASIMIVALGLVIAYIWLGYLLSLEPLWSGNDRADAYTFAAAVVYTVAFVAGAFTATAGRKLAARFSGLSYPAVAVLILLMTLVPLFFVVGL